jgi:hypothetical protein
MFPDYIKIEALSRTSHMNSKVRQPVHRQTDRQRNPLQSDLKKRRMFLFVRSHLNLFCISRLCLEAVASPIENLKLIDLNFLGNDFSKVKERGHEDAAKFLWLTIRVISGTFLNMELLKFLDYLNIYWLLQGDSATSRYILNLFSSRWYQHTPIC